MRSRKILIGVETAGVTRCRRHLRTRISGSKGPRLVLGAIDAVRKIACSKRRNRTLNDTHIHLLELVGKGTAKAAMKIREDSNGSARRIAPDDRAGRRELGQVDLLSGSGRRCCSTCRTGGRHLRNRRFAFFFETRLRRSTQQHIGVHFEKLCGRQVLSRFHVIDAADDEIARGPVDVEEGLPGNHLAKSRDLVAVDRRHLCFRQARLEQRGDPRGLEPIGGVDCRRGAPKKQCGD